MSTLFIFLQIQVLVSLVVAAALWRCLRRSVRPIIEQNCRRLDGTFSQRRELIELQSLRHSSISILKALLLSFALSFFLGLAILGFTIMRVDRLELVAPSEKIVSPNFDQSIVDIVNEWQWHFLMIYYVVSSFIFIPCLSYAYQHALQKFRTRANARFQQYYQKEWWNASEATRKKLANEQRVSPIPKAEHFVGGAPLVQD